jgi:GntR family transcriptional repressor for pyruvate dehydrogenase complex
MRTSLRHTSIYEEIRQRLQDMVKRGNLKPGDRLPPERQLAALFGVSRNSLREAIKSLEQRGSLISRPGAGTYLSDNMEPDPTIALGEALARERHKIADIFELRLLLEPQIAHLAAQRISKDELAHLKGLIDAYEEAMLARLPVLDLDHAFHDAVATSTGNQSIVKLMEAMHELLHESRDEALQSPKRIANSLRDHARILDALSKGDAHGARQAMCEHLQHTQEIVFTATFGE